MEPRTSRQGALVCPDVASDHHGNILPSMRKITSLRDMEILNTILLGESVSHIILLGESVSHIILLGESVSHIILLVGLNESYHT